MDSSSNTPKFLKGVLASLLGCLSLQAAAYFGLGYGTGKTESNYFSTISRFQGACAPGATVAVSGSSITGRLPGRESGNPQVANLGSDGGSPVDGLKLISEGVVSRPRWLVIETNTLFNGIGYDEMPAVKGARGAWFAFGGRLPLVGAAARPSGMLYARLLGRSWAGHVDPFPILQLPGPLVSKESPSFEFTPLETGRIEEVVRHLAELRSSGVRILLVNYPAGVMKPRDSERMRAAIEVISGRLEVPFLDLEAVIPRDSLTFTDAVHLGPASAALIVDTIQAVCLKLEESGNTDPDPR